jgi:ATP-dependent Clp protease ATP-binding subunit ClpA
MFDGFTNRAKEVMLLAAEESQRLGHPQIGTSHVLLGLIREGRGVAMVALAMMNLDLRRLVRAVEQPSDIPDDALEGENGYTPAARRMLERAPLEAQELHDPDVGTEHLLLAILHDHRCHVTQILIAMGLHPNLVRTVLISLLTSAKEPDQIGKATDLSGLEGKQRHVQLSVQLSRHASQVDALANEEAHRLNHDWVATEHLLLALLRDAEGNAARLLQRQGIDLGMARSAAMQLLPAGARPSPSGRLPLTLGAQHVLEYAVRQARPLDEDVLYLATEHLLLGLLRETKSIAGKILQTLGVDPEDFRHEVETLIDRGEVPPEDDAEDGGTSAT